MKRESLDRRNKKLSYSTLWENYTNKLKPITWIYEKNVKIGMLKDIPLWKNEDDEENRVK